MEVFWLDIHKIEKKVIWTWGWVFSQSKGLNTGVSLNGLTNVKLLKFGMTIQKIKFLMMFIVHQCANFEPEFVYLHCMRK
jgi:hypothetical protein